MIMMEEKQSAGVHRVLLENRKKAVITGVQDIHSFNENVVLCASSAYEKKFYLNEAFDKLPEDIKNELKIMCVLFTEEVGGILTLEFDENGTLLFKTEADENDLLYDDIACGMLIKKLQYEKRDLLESMEMFYRVFFLGE